MKSPYSERIFLFVGWGSWGADQRELQRDEQSVMTCDMGRSKLKWRARWPRSRLYKPKGWEGGGEGCVGGLPWNTQQGSQLRLGLLCQGFQGRLKRSAPSYEPDGRLLGDV